VILVDTGVWIDYFNGHGSPSSLALTRLIDEGQTGSLLIGDLILLELLQGFRSEREATATRDALQHISVIELGGIARAVSAAANYRLLRSRGITVRTTIDCLIATFCIEEDVELLQRDRDFRPFAEHLGLRLLPT
jgi:predicted nucleic acid-binding protein